MVSKNCFYKSLQSGLQESCKFGIDGGVSEWVENGNTFLYPPPLLVAKHLLKKCICMCVLTTGSGTCMKGADNE